MKSVWIVDGENGYGDARRLGVYVSRQVAEAAIERDRNDYSMADSPNPACVWEAPHEEDVIE